MNINDNKKFLEECINKKLSLKKIGKLVNKHPSTIKNWMDKYDLKTSYSSLYKGCENKNEKCCAKCKVIKPLSEFHKKNGRRRGKDCSTYCKICSSLRTKNIYTKFKQDCVTYKGNKCVKCGYSKYIGALEFHHLDPLEKDFALSTVKYKNFHSDESVKRELDKCILVCSNCHREIHGNSSTM